MDLILGVNGWQGLYYVVAYRLRFGFLQAVDDRAGSGCGLGKSWPNGRIVLGSEYNLNLQDGSLLGVFWSWHGYAPQNRP